MRFTSARNGFTSSGATLRHVTVQILVLEVLLNSVRILVEALGFVARHDPVEVERHAKRRVVRVVGRRRRQHVAVGLVGFDV
jgi:hypothetical protein